MQDSLLVCPRLLCDEGEKEKEKNVMCHYIPKLGYFSVTQIKKLNILIQRKNI